MTAKEKYYQLLLEERRAALAAQNAATIDYNVMMGNLESPEEEEQNDG